LPDLLAGWREAASCQDMNSPLDHCDRLDAIEKRLVHLVKHRPFWFKGTRSRTS
jgi:hypothetical protein